MAICENCGTKYRPTEVSPDCPRCAEEAARPQRRKKKQGFDKPTQIGFGIAGGLLVMTLIIVFTVKGKHDDTRQALEAQAKEISDLWSELSSINIHDQKGAQLVLDRAKATREIWTGSTIALDVTQLMGKAQAALDSSKQRESITERYAAVDRDLATPDKLTPERAKEIRHELEEIESMSALGGADFEAKVKARRKEAERICAQRLLADAEASAAANQENPRLALRRAIAAEESVFEVFAVVSKAKKQDEIDFYKPIYQALVALTDKLSTTVFTAEGSDTMAWKDYLNGDLAKGWNGSKTPGFSWRLENGELQIVGPDEGVAEQAVLAIGDAEKWRNLVVELVITIDKGFTDLFFRTGRSPNASTPAFLLTINPEKRDAIEPGTPTRVRISLLGSNLVAYFPDGGPDKYEEVLTWNYYRKGAICFRIPPGARFKVTEFKVRELL